MTQENKMSERYYTYAFEKMANPHPILSLLPHVFIARQLNDTFQTQNS